MSARTGLRAASGQGGGAIITVAALSAAFGGVLVMVIADLVAAFDAAGLDGIAQAATTLGVVGGVFFGIAVFVGAIVTSNAVSTVIAEVRGFRRAVEHGGGVAAGLHLETSVDDVAECVADASVLGADAGPYRSLCDPRLSPGQATEVVTAWSSLDRFIVPGGAPYAGRL